MMVENGLLMSVGKPVYFLIGRKDMVVLMVIVMSVFGKKGNKKKDWRKREQHQLDKNQPESIVE